jgi:GTP 3',8-cyclase
MTNNKILSKLVDPYGRLINYFRVSITDRCNFKCCYCTPEKHSIIVPPSIVPFKSLIKIIETAGKIGFDKVRLTGGEPLIRADVVNIIDAINNCGYYNTIAMTTNGSLLTKKMMSNLHSAGLTHLTISLDTLDNFKFKNIAGVDALDRIVSAIKEVKKNSFKEIKINMVVFENTTIQEVTAMREFCKMNGFKLQTIREFSIKDRNKSAATIIPTDRPLNCNQCNRIRLTSNGYIRPCLFDEMQIPVNLENIESSIRLAVLSKPREGTCCDNKSLSAIGG